MLEYVRKNGIKRCFQVIYQYKVDRVLCKILMLFLKGRKLKDIIIIESHNDFDSNGGALYEYLIDNEYNEKYKIVWLIKNLKPFKLPKNVECYYLHKPSLKKDYYICMAKYLFSDNTVTDKMRLEQKSIYCGHGSVSLKETHGLCTIPDTVDYILSPSKNYDEILSYELSIPYPNNRMIHVGYPAEDVYFKKIPNEVKKITTRTFKKVILWMPTFRRGGGFRRNDSNGEQLYGIPILDSIEMYNKLNMLLHELNILLIIKIHPMQDLNTIVNLKETDNIKVLTGISIKLLEIDNYRLMSNVDALISDYSSSAFSYLLLNRPLGFVLADLEDYKLGLCVENVDDYLVGNKIFTFEDMVEFIKDVANSHDLYEAKRCNLIKWLYKHQDGESCKRLIEYVGM